MPNDLALTTDERRTLACVLDELIPRSQDGRFPAAGEADVVAYLCGRMQTRPALHATVRAGLAALDADARTRGGGAFAA